MPGGGIYATKKRLEAPFLGLYERGEKRIHVAIHDSARKGGRDRERRDPKKRKTKTQSKYSFSPIGCQLL